MPGLRETVYSRENCVPGIAMVQRVAGMCPMIVRAEYEKSGEDGLKLVRNWLK